ncbi:MAG: Ig-like domain-containing protein, partial [Solirubrobacterales bacterium]
MARAAAGRDAIASPLSECWAGRGVGRGRDPGDAIASGPANGTLIGFDSMTGAVTYTPNPGFTGTDQIVYRGVNGTLHSGNTTVTFSVKGPVQPTPSVQQPPPAPFDLKAAIRKCKKK